MKLIFLLSVAFPHNKFVREHIVTVVQEGKSKSGYVDHFKTSGETGLVISSGLWNILEETESTESIVALGVDIVRDGQLSV